MGLREARVARSGMMRPVLAAVLVLVLGFSNASQMESELRAKLVQKDQMIQAMKERQTQTNDATTGLTAKKLAEQEAMIEDLKRKGTEKDAMIARLTAKSFLQGEKASGDFDGIEGLGNDLGDGTPQDREERVEQCMQVLKEAASKELDNIATVENKKSVLLRESNLATTSNADSGTAPGGGSDPVVQCKAACAHAKAKAFQSTSDDKRQVWAQEWAKEWYKREASTKEGKKTYKKMEEALSLMAQGKQADASQSTSW